MWDPVDTYKVSFLFLERGVLENAAFLWMSIDQLKLHKKSKAFKAAANKSKDERREQWCGQRHHVHSPTLAGT
jgi:hypothetical protein